MKKAEAHRKYMREYMRKQRAGEKTAQDNGLSRFLTKLDWKPIPGYPGYMASKCGQIKSCSRQTEKSNGQRHTISERVLKQYNSSHGYPRVTFSIKGKNVQLAVHRAVYLTYGGPIPDGYVVDHIDGSRDNNHIKNLQILERLENLLKRVKDAYSQGFRVGYAQALEDLNNGRKFNSRND